VRRQKELCGQLSKHVLCLWQKHKLEHKHQNFISGRWILTVFFVFWMFCGVLRPFLPYMEAQGALGAMVGLHLMAVRATRTCWWWNEALSPPREGTSPFLMSVVLIFFSSAACLPLIIMWSLDLPVSFHQRFK
jgi:hypothetical protein